MRNRLTNRSPAPQTPPGSRQPCPAPTRSQRRGHLRKDRRRLRSLKPAERTHPCRQASRPKPASASARPAKSSSTWPTSYTSSPPLTSPEAAPEFLPPYATQTITKAELRKTNKWWVGKKLVLRRSVHTWQATIEPGRRVTVMRKFKGFEHPHVILRPLRHGLSCQTDPSALLRVAAGQQNPDGCTVTQNTQTLYVPALQRPLHGRRIHAESRRLPTHLAKPPRVLYNTRIVRPHGISLCRKDTTPGKP